MEDSIRISIKKLLNVSSDDTSFDEDITIAINTCLMTLNQLGVGPEQTFVVTDDTQTWEDFLGDDYQDLQPVKTYVYMKTRLMFDPPQVSAVLAALKESIAEYEWRLNVAADQRVYSMGD